MKKILFFILIALNAKVLHAYEAVADNIELTSLFATQADEKVVLLDSIVTYLSDGSLSEKTIYEYDDKGLLTLEIMYKWQEGSWNNSKKKEYHYYKNGKLKSLECCTWAYSSWEKSYKDEWTYDDHGNQTSWDRTSAYRGEYYYVSNTKYENTYDDHGNLTDVIEYLWGSSNWEKNKKVENTYNSSDLLTCTVQYSWENNQWQPKNKHEYTYDANGNLSIEDVYSWFRDWQKNQRFENTYDDNGHLLSHIEFLGGDNGEYLHKAEYTYDAEGNVADETVFYWNYIDKEWTRSSHTVYSYSAHTVILPGTPTLSDTYDFELDGIEYSILSIEDCTVEVSDTRHLEYDELVIPASFSFKGRELKVIAIGYNAIKNYYEHNGEWEYRYFKTIQLPETVEKICRGAFSGQTSLEEIELPESLTSISNCAFASCYSLKKVSLHEGIKSVGDSAFIYCVQLEEITLPDGVEEIGRQAFSYTGLRSFNFPASTKYVGSDLFTGCPNLEYVNLENLQAMGTLPYALFYNAGVKKVVIPDWVTEIPNFFVSSCKEIKEFEFGKSVVRIKEGAFKSCNLPRSFRLPETLKVIDDYAFSSATAEGSIVIPGNVEEIAGYALNTACDSLILEPGDEALQLIRGYTYIGSRESHYLRLERGIKMKDGVNCLYLYGDVIELGKDCLESFTKTKNYGIMYDHPVRLSILEGVEELSYNYDCQYTNTLLLPSTLRTISTSNFVGAKSLTSIDCRATEPPLCDGKIFADGTYAKAKLTVPLGCKDAYLNAEGWKYFWEIEETAEPLNNESQNGIIEVQDENSSWFSINNGELKASATLDLYTLDGRLVKQAANGDISDIAHGIYIIKCGSRTAKIAL